MIGKYLRSLQKPVTFWPKGTPLNWNGFILMLPLGANLIMNILYAHGIYFNITSVFIHYVAKAII